MIGQFHYVMLTSNVIYQVCACGEVCKDSFGFPLVSEALQHSVLDPD